MLHNSPSALELTPSIWFVFVRLFYFLLSPRSYSCSGKKCALPTSESLVDHRLAVKRMVRRVMNVCRGEGGNVTLMPLTRKKNLMEKHWTRESRSWQTNAKRRKKRHKVPASSEKGKEGKRKRKRQRKKKWKRKKSTKVRIYIPPPTALEYKKTKKRFLD